MIKQQTPNLLTILNLSCGCIGVVACFHQNLELAGYLIWLAAIFDFFDGFISRILHVSSTIGKELDSLADMISFGLLPSSIVFVILEQLSAGIFSYSAFLLAVFAAIRLARFNVDQRQSKSFIGMPTPAMAFFISGLPFWCVAYPWAITKVGVISVSVLLSLFMVAPITMLSLKFDNFSLSKNVLKYSLILGGIVLLIALKTLSLPLIIVLYILLSFTKGLVSKQ